MRNRIAFAVTAALALTACDMLGMGRDTGGETEKNGASEEETKDGNSSRDEEGSERGQDESERGSRGSRDGEEGSDSGPREESEDSGRSSGASSSLERDIERAVSQQQSRLPMRDGPGTVTAMEAEGNRLIVIMEIEQDLNEAQWNQMSAALHRNICGDRNSRRMIDRGAEVVYRVTDGDGERVNMTTNDCNV